MTLSPQIESRASKMRYYLVLLSYVAACSMAFFSWRFDSGAVVFRYLTAGAALLSFDLKRWDKFKVFLVLFLLVALVARRLLVVWTLFALVYQIDNLKIPLKKIALVGLAVLSIEIFLQLEMLAFDLVMNRGEYYTKVNRIVYDLGTGNTNRCGALFYYWIILLYVVLKDRHRFLYVILSLSVAWLVFYITGSRTGFYGAIIINLVAVFYWKGWIKSWMRWALVLLPAVLFAGTFYLAANMADNEGVNEAASGRLYYVVMFTQEYSTRDWLIGAPRELDEPLDSSYLDIICTGGILLAVFMCTAYMGTIAGYFKRTAPYLPIILAVLASGLTETIFVNPNAVSVVFWILILQCFIRQKPILSES